MNNPSKESWNDRCKRILEKHSIAPLTELKVLMGGIKNDSHLGKPNKGN